MTIKLGQSEARQNLIGRVAVNQVKLASVLPF